MSANKMPHFHLLLTGQRRDDHYRVDVNGRPVWLSCLSLETLLHLLRATIEAESRLATAPRAAIHRLRKSLDAVLGSGFGRRCIVTGAGEEYGLAIAKDEIWHAVGIAPCFYELIALTVVTQSQAELLRKHCRKRSLRALLASPSRRRSKRERARRATERKLRRNRSATKRRPNGN